MLESTLPKYDNKQYISLGILKGIFIYLKMLVNKYFAIAEKGVITTMPTPSWSNKSNPIVLKFKILFQTDVDFAASPRIKDFVTVAPQQTFDFQ